MKIHLHDLTVATREDLTEHVKVEGKLTDSCPAFQILREGEQQNKCTELQKSRF